MTQVFGLGVLPTPEIFGFYRRNFMEINIPKKTAILIDGGFYRRRAHNMLGKKSPKERADELNSYCIRHLRNKK